MSTQIQLSNTKPTSQEIEQALINVVKAEDPEEYVVRLAQTIFPNKDKYNQIKNDYKEYYGRDPRILNAIMDLYKLYYELAKDNFVKEEQIDEEAEDYFNS
ncbi:hypothetical protein RhiirC2_802005 [Rhizophagus irregularis]|uniref:Uncharacterized protein n=1 Tax=Rhizophagus irregularis TaxID=588596 RepID=A0A2N1M1V1_9GLOM|nr:hypothetical protein RhiirC2_802005 [Rhizophagus irregularis]